MIKYYTHISNTYHLLIVYVHNMFTDYIYIYVEILFTYTNYIGVSTENSFKDAPCEALTAAFSSTPCTIVFNVTFWDLL